MSVFGRDSSGGQGGTPCLMARVECQVQNNVAVTRFLMKNVLLAAAGVAPRRCPDSFPFCFLSTLTAHSTGNLHIPCNAFYYQRTRTSYHIFNFITRKGVLLIMVVQ